MNRASKLIVFVSNLAALWLVATLVSRGFPLILSPAIAAFTASLVSALYALGSDTQERGVAIGNLMFADEDPPKGSLTIEHLPIEGGEQ